ncbi:MAG: rhomboid family intramembrane serine protease [Planctomycetota bacterium]|nr:rhomboid family intramembrane serine protease [Planctomycetota bacterium]
MILPYKIDIETERTPHVTYALVAVNVLVFALTGFGNAAGEELFYRYGVVPDAPTVLSLFTSAFLHVNWVHLLLNMFFLWLFGPGVEDRLGRILFAVAYVALGALAALMHTLLVPGHLGDIPAVGASGAISGVMGLFVAVHPRARVKFLYFSEWTFLKTLASMPAFMFLGFWFIGQVLLWSLGAGEIQEVAFEAHLGGFAGGFVLGIAVAARAHLRLLGAASRRRAELERCIDELRRGNRKEAAAVLQSLAQDDSSPAAGLFCARIGAQPASMETAEGCLVLLRGFIERNDGPGAVSAYIALREAGGDTLMSGRDYTHVAKGLMKMQRPRLALSVLKDCLQKSQDRAEDDHVLFEIARCYQDRIPDAEKAMSVLDMLLKTYPGSRWSKLARETQAQ